MSDLCIIFLHGYGSNGEDFEEIHKIFEECLDAEVYSPNAFTPMPSMDESYMWYPLKTIETDGGKPHYCNENIEDGVLTVLPQLEEYIETVSKERPVIVIGFSQGGNVALNLALRSSLPNLMACISCGGYLQPFDTPVHPDRSILLLQGMDDTVVEPLQWEHIIRFLTRRRVEFSASLVKDCAHEINDEMLELMIHFMLYVLDQNGFIDEDDEGSEEEK